jgi:hypothetical protein
MNITQAITANRIFDELPAGGSMDEGQLLNQIGAMNVLAISGGRRITQGANTLFPVSNGYFVTVTINNRDLYDVKLFKANKNKAAVVMDWDDIGAEIIHEVAYQASCFNNWV